MDYNEILQSARTCMGPYCKACPVCNRRACGNTIEKVFHHPSKVTVVEAREAQKAGRDAEAVFYDKWVEKNKGVTRNKAKGASGNGGNSGRPGGGAPQAGGGQQKKTNSLFGGNK